MKSHVCRVFFAGTFGSRLRGSRKCSDDPSDMTLLRRRVHRASLSGRRLRGSGKGSTGSAGKALRGFWSCCADSSTRGFFIAATGTLGVLHVCMKRVGSSHAMHPWDSGRSNGAEVSNAVMRCTNCPQYYVPMPGTMALPC
jgi:hypothetical protein